MVFEFLLIGNESVWPEACALQEKNQRKWAGRDRFPNLWIWKRAFMRLKAEGGQNVLISCRAGWMIWNGPGPLCVVVIQGELLLQVVYTSLHVTKCPHHFSRHSVHKHAIIPEIEHHCHPHSCLWNVLFWNVFPQTAFPQDVTLNGRCTARTVLTSHEETRALGWQ